MHTVYMEFQNQTPEIHRERSSASISDYKFHAAVHTVTHTVTHTVFHKTLLILAVGAPYSPSLYLPYLPSLYLPYSPSLYLLLELLMLMRAERCLFGMGNTCTS